MASTITVSELRNRRPMQVQLIDVRSAAEFAAGHIPGASNIPIEQIEARLEDLADAPLVLICQSGQRARMTADLLHSPAREISVLEGGTSAWKQAGLPLVCCVRTRWSLERQVRLIAGVAVLSSAGLALTMNAKWIFLSAFVGLGLMFAGLTDVCPMGILLAKMPWNRNARCASDVLVSAPPHERERLQSQRVGSGK